MIVVCRFFLKFAKHFVFLLQAQDSSVDLLPLKTRVMTLYESCIQVPHTHSSDCMRVAIMSLVGF